MGVIVYRVHADWDPEAKVWVATSDDVPGLATEAPTVEALAEKLRIMIPELLEANQLLSGDQPDAIAFELTSHRSFRSSRNSCSLTIAVLNGKVEAIKRLVQSLLSLGTPPTPS